MRCAFSWANAANSFRRSSGPRRRISLRTTRPASLAMISSSRSSSACLFALLEDCPLTKGSNLADVADCLSFCSHLGNNWHMHSGRLQFQNFCNQFNWLSFNVGDLDVDIPVLAKLSKNSFCHLIPALQCFWSISSEKRFVIWGLASKFFWTHTSLTFFSRSVREPSDTLESPNIATIIKLCPIQTMTEG